MALLPSVSKRRRSLSPRRGKASTNSPLRLASCSLRTFLTRGRDLGVPANADFTTSVHRKRKHLIEPKVTGDPLSRPLTQTFSSDPYYSSDLRRAVTRIRCWDRDGAPAA